MEQSLALPDEYDVSGGRAKTEQALTAAEALALRVIADRLEHSEAIPGEMTVSFAA